MDIYSLRLENANVNHLITAYSQNAVDEYYELEYGHAENSALGYDSDLEGFLLNEVKIVSMGFILSSDNAFDISSVAGTREGEDYIYLYDGSSAFLVETYNMENRFDDLPDETWLDFNKMHPVPDELLVNGNLRQTVQQ